MQGEVFFQKTVPPSSSMSSYIRTCQLVIPRSFIRDHGDKFHDEISLQCGTSAKKWPVTLHIHVSEKRVVKVQITNGWKDFSAFHRINEGDELILCLKEKTLFKVYIFSAPIPVAPSKHQCPKHTEQPQEKVAEISTQRETQLLRTQVSDLQARMTNLAEELQLAKLMNAYLERQLNIRRADTEGNGRSCQQHLQFGRGARKRPRELDAPSGAADAGEK